MNSPRKVTYGSALLSNVEEVQNAVLQNNTIKTKLRDAAVAAAKAHYELSLLKESNSTD